MITEHETTASAKERPQRSHARATRTADTPREAERSRQIRGLLWLALAILLFSLLRAGLHNVFTPVGWWRLW